MFCIVITLLDVDVMGICVYHYSMALSIIHLAAMPVVKFGFRSFLLCSNVFRVFIQFAANPQTRYFCVLLIQSVHPILDDCT